MKQTGFCGSPFYLALLNFMTKTIYFEDIQQHLVINYKRGIKNINLRIKPYKGLVVSVPIFTSEKEIRYVLNKKKKWIVTALKKVEAKEANGTSFNPGSTFSTQHFSAEIYTHKSPRFKAVLNEKKLMVFCPIQSNFDDEQVQKQIRQYIDLLWIKEAELYLPERLKHISLQTSLHYKQLNLKNLKSVWGSCSSKDDITLNIQMMHLPYHLIDYIILHELCHTLEKNHSKKFWQALDYFTDGKALVLRKELNAYSPKIY